jgi:predicted signal transduction protein with EAL and GGDEF domain
MKVNTVEWLHNRGQDAIKQPSWFIPMMAVISLIFLLAWIAIVVSEIVNGKSIIAAIGGASVAPFFFLALINGLVTLLWYERRHYYEIIQSQERKIRELEKKQTG